MTIRQFRWNDIVLWWDGVVDLSELSADQLFSFEFIEDLYRQIQPELERRRKLNQIEGERNKDLNFAYKEEKKDD